MLIFSVEYHSIYIFATVASCHHDVFSFLFSLHYDNNANHWISIYKFNFEDRCFQKTIPSMNFDYFRSLKVLIYNICFQPERVLKLCLIFLLAKFGICIFGLLWVLGILLILISMCNFTGAVVNPFCIVKCEGETLKTNIVRDSTTPMWNTKFIFYKKESTEKSPIVIQVFILMRNIPTMQFFTGIAEILGQSLLC